MDGNGPNSDLNLLLDGKMLPANNALKKGRGNSPMKTHDGPIFLPFQPSIMVVLLALAGMVLLAIPLFIGRLICGGWYD